MAADTPTGAGFGDAALAIAGRAPDDPTVEVPQAEVDTPRPITFIFRLSPPEVEPNVLLPRVIEPLGWLGIPALGIKRDYPKKAQRLGVEGRVILDCYIASDGRYRACAVASETPPGWGFGRSALGMTPMFRSKPPKARPTGSDRVIIPMDFKRPS